MKRWSIAMVAVFTLFSTWAVAQEGAAIKAAIENEASNGVMLALPTTAGDAAPAIPGGATSQSFYANLTTQQEKNITDKAYPLMASKWPFNEVWVCWEELQPDFSAQRQLVREAVRDTWEANSGIRFVGWGQCNPSAGGIRIAVKDEGPHVKFLGKFVNGIKNGMVLNFTYNNWSPACQSMLDYCNRVIAVHEFGHAIGFAHEQNRPDTPGECDKRQGTDGDNTQLTPWDVHSVMNYCNPVYSNDGVLSQFDIIAVKYIYGAG
ncbi:M12 family metallopeptidase [Sinorhizobium terangae]|uniref:M12 family metallopeptidase n=1 Tax=Sinorhizobium terangae TaxID=110322 RepID=UPI0024B1F0FC|nr:M12 family metallopeptidase [Sinorhizobium terangae]WFU50703.1 M12 family metallopeptidase [Sinorhizobium terangae]